VECSGAHAKEISNIAYHAANNGEEGQTMRRNRNKPKPTKIKNQALNHNQSAPAQNGTPQSGSAQNEPVARSAGIIRVLKWFNSGRVAIVITVAISIVGFFFQNRQNEINEEVKRIQQEQARTQQEQAKIEKNTFDRLTGKIAAKMQFAEIHPSPDEMQKLITSTGLNKTPYQGMDYFLKYNKPRLFINNVGEESIEAIRITTSMIDVSTVEKNLFDPKDYQEVPGIILKEEQSLRIKAYQDYCRHG
jgi:hypothetical protein